MQLVNLLMYPVYDVPEQVRRRIGFNASTGALDDLAAAVELGGEKAVGTQQYQEALSAIVGFDGTQNGFERPFINVSDDDNHPVQFQWESRDTGIFNFVAVFIAKPLNATRTQETQYIVSGYTSQAETSLGSLLPDDMVLYINDIYGLQATYTHDALGGKTLNPDSFRLLDNYVLSKALSVEGQTESTVDIISIAKAADMVKRIEMNSGEKFVPTSDSVLSATSSSAPQLMVSQLQRPENYVSAISNAYLASSGVDTELGSVESFFAGNNSIGVESELKQRGVIRNYSNHELIAAMRQALQNGMSDVSGGWKATSKATFRLADLRNAIVNPMRLDECIRESLALASRRGLGAGLVNQTDHWIGRNGFSTQGSLVAYDLAMSIGPIMSRNLIGEVSFVFDNRNTDIMIEPTLEVIPNSVSSITHHQLPAALGRRFLQNMKEAMVQVTKHNHIRCHMLVTALLGTVTRIEIRVDDEPLEYYTYASFMQFRLHTGNTTDLKYVGELAQNTATLLKAVEEGYTEFEKGQGRGRMLSNIPTNTGGLDPLGGLDLGGGLGGIGGNGLGNGLID
ncbi:hypothetical protein [Salmonella enterica]|uniref:hypothetical protein n=2 Tax=Salmonella enterica TaxID=28901 RepID=UPI0010FB346A|nr:hypothetical protein [Salmonella enterica]TLA35639.1 hypothetical protein E2E58_21340 [Salmonella enterica subsp. enterica serovar Newport]